MNIKVTTMWEGPGISIETPVRHAAPLPARVDVAIIGGGIIGVCAGLYLARKGLKAVILEKGRIAGEQSSRNWGWIRQQGRDEAELPIMMESIRLWEELDAQTGGATGFQRTGVLYLASTRKELEALETWYPIAARHGLEIRQLSKSEMGEMLHRPAGNHHEWVGATFTPSDGRAEPWQAVPALADLAAGEGVAICENMAVRALDIEGGQVRGVVTQAGRISCNKVVLAGGGWSSLFLRNHGVSIPQLSVKASVVRTAPLPYFFAGNAVDNDLAFRRRQDGGYTLALGESHDHFLGPDSFRHFLAFLPTLKASLGITRLLPWAPADFPDAWLTKRRWNADETSPFERCRVAEPVASPSSVRKMQRLFAQRFPQLGEPEILNAWGGMIDTTPDIVPIVDHVRQLPGLFVATGMSGHGFGIGPGFGRVIADMVAGDAPGHEMSRFRFSRFGGSKLEPGPAL
ncbi:MAG: FAD-binding oxidoreductase [Rhizobiaceae bacterium]